LSNDQEWIKKLRNNFTNEEIENHLNAILSSKSHSLNLILISFIKKFETNYNQKNFLKFQNEREFLMQAIEDVQVFIDKLIYILILKYWNLSENLNSRIDLKLFENVLYHKILNFLFSNGIYLYLLNFYKIQQDIKKNDTLILKKFYEFNSGNYFHLHSFFEEHFKLKNFGMNEKLIFPEFEEIIDNLKEFDRIEKINKKLSLLSNSVDEIFSSLTLKNPHLKLKEFIQNDDIVKIFSYCVVKSKIEFPFSILSIIEDFKVNDDIQNDFDYSLNIYKLSLHFILKFKVEEVKKSINPFDDF
jgi:hypothetical protein